MIVNSESLRQTRIGIRAAFAKAFEAIQTDHERYALMVPSTKRREEYKWLGASSRVQEFLDDAQFNRPGAYTWAIDNKTWQVGVEIEREDLEDDSLGLLNPFIAKQAREAKLHVGELVWDLLNGGFAGLCYDNQYFFDTDHQDNDGPIQSNKITTVLGSGGFQEARELFRTLKDGKGRPASRGPSHLVVPPALESAAEALLEAQFLASGASNTNYKKVALVVSPFLTSETAWFMLDLTDEIKPFIIQNRRGWEFAAQDGASDEQNFMRRIYRYSWTARYQAGYGMWNLAVGSTGAG